MKTFEIDKKMIKIITTQIINGENLQDYIYRQVAKKKYSNYLNKIIINNKDTYFDQFNKRLLINLKEILEEGNQLFIDSFLTNKKDIFINTWTLLIIIHEMEHIKHRSYFYGGAKDNLEDYICHEINFSTTEIPSDDYKKYHNYFLYERLATFSAFGSIFDLFSKINLDKDLYDVYLQYMLYYLKDGYEELGKTMKGPLETVFELMNIKKEKIKKLHKGKMSILEKTEFGFPLRLEQYHKVKTKLYNKYF